MARGKCPRLRVVCQWCNRINHTKNLEMELVCSYCRKYAKYRSQKLRKTKIMDRTHNAVFEIYEVANQSKPCPDCKKLIPTGKNHRHLEAVA